MGIEIDLLRNYPQSKRNLDQRSSRKSPKVQAIARKFAEEYFDGSRDHGYGGYSYDPKFWSPVIPDLVRHFGIKPGDRILDVGCGKGFMLFDLLRLCPGVSVQGIDISEYAVSNSLPQVKPYLQIGDAKNLPFEESEFDVVFSVNTVHNLKRQECGEALREIERVAARGAFVTVDAYRTEEEMARMHQWNLTALTIMSVEEWEQFFSDVGYTGDYYWFLP